MTKHIVLASSNPGKVREINQMLGGLHLAVVPQSDFKVIDAEETGLTFVENALLKARNATRHAGRPAIADDSVGIPESERTARFQCLMVYLRHELDPTPIICQGTWEGRILFEPRGANGFGYDPIFFVPTHNCSSAELPPEVKNKLSHRGQALRALVGALGHTHL